MKASRGQEFDADKPMAERASSDDVVPRPRVNLFVYHGVLAPRASWRQAIVPGTGKTVIGPGKGDDGDATGDRTLVLSGGSNYRWAELMRRTFGIDVLACPRCGGCLRLITLIDQPASSRASARGSSSRMMRPSRAPSNARPNLTRHATGH